MSTNLLCGQLLKKMLIGGVESLKRNSPKINELNVFPVPDGDTGTNMTKTMEGGLSRIINDESESAYDVIKSFAEGLIFGARGNSGVILSQIFAGIKDGLVGKKELCAAELADAYENGIERSYAAVTNPAEGTILTVFREGAEYAKSHLSPTASLEEFFELHIDEVKRSLMRTKELLPVLREADVVDSGGAGYLCIAEGMYSALTGDLDASAYSFDEDVKSTGAPDYSRFTRDSVAEYGYCTEFLLRLTTYKCDPDAFNADTIINELSQLGGESIVAFKEDDILKVHVHMSEPGKALCCAQKYGEFLTVKIENMSIDHSEQVSFDEDEKSASPRRAHAIAAVASGDGISELFLNIGADIIVSGGQTDNPSTEEFIEAFDRLNADDIYVFPNNKNVTLAANQAASMYEGSRVHVVPTASLMQGYAALSVINPDGGDAAEVVAEAMDAAKGVVGSEITCAVRDVTLGGKQVKKGDYIAITDGSISTVAKTNREALLSMLAELDMSSYEMITVFVGAGADAGECDELEEMLTLLYPEHEVILYNGKQEVYDYLVAVE